jgi:AAA family ATP:ADP antiporter
MGQPIRSRLALLIGQAFALGLTLALLVVVGNALFLSDYGAAALPYTYITVALAGTLLSYGFAALQSRYTIPQLTITTISGLVLFYLLCWLGVTVVTVRGVSFALVVSFALLLQLGFVFLGGQAGRLFDVRQIRQLFSFIVAGFVMGFIVGALVVPPLVSWLGSTANATIGLVGTSLLWLLLLIITSNRYRSKLSQVDDRGRSPSRQSLPQLLQNRFVLFIFLYQMLAIAVNQFTDFIMMTQVGARYTTSESTAQFFSRFTAIMNGTDLLFTTLFAGFFLSRFGLNAGLLANPVAAAIILLIMGLSYLILGPSSTLFFLLAVGIRIAIITLTDATTRTSTNTTYQALPAQDRSPVQAGVEGIGGPIALGITGVLLLIFNNMSSLTLGHLVFFTLILAGAWAGLGLLVYRNYASTLLRTLRQRALGEVELSLADGSSLAVVERLVKSERLSDVQLALDVMDRSDRPALERFLVRLLTHPDEAMQIEALHRLETRQTPAAQSVVEGRWRQASSSQVRGLALRVLCAYQRAESVEWVAPLMDDPEAAVRLNALAGLLRYGGISGAMLAGERLMTLTHSPVTAERLMAAQVIEAVKQNNFYQPLLVLLADKQAEVRQAALLAAAQSPHPHLLSLVVENLNQSATRSAAAAALLAYGPALLPVADQALAGQMPLEQRQLIRLVRVCGQVKGEATIALLKQYLNHPDREVRGQVMVALNNCDYRASNADLPVLMAIMHSEVAHAVYALTARQDVGEGAAIVPLQRALDEEWRQARQHLFYLLACLYDNRAMLRAGEQLARGSDGEKALALELLDVTLTTEQKGLLFPLVRPQLTPSQRQQQLAARFPISPLSQEERLRRLILGGQGPALKLWTQACAVYVAGQLGLHPLVEAIAAIHLLADSLLHETTTWALARLSV